MNFIDIVVRKVFNDKFLNNKIFSFIKVQSHSKKYEQLVHVDWMINNDHIQLLKYKIIKNHYLILSPECVRFLFRIQDIDLFKLCFQRFKDYLPNENYPPILNYAAQYNNLEIIRYLLDQIPNSNYSFDHTALEFSCKHSNLEMFDYLLEKSTKSTKSTKSIATIEITIECLSNSLKSKNINIVEYIFQKFDNQQQQQQHQQTINQRIILTFLEISCNNIDIFKFIINRYSVSKFDKYIYSQSIGNIEVFKFLFEKYKKDWYGRIDVDSLCLAAGVKNYIQVVEYMLANNMVSELGIKVTISHILSNGHIESFKRLNRSHDFKQYQLCLSMIPHSTVNIDTMKWYLAIGVEISKNCIIQSCYNSFPIFQFIWKHLVTLDHIDNSKRDPRLIFNNSKNNFIDFTFDIIDACLNSNNLLVLEFIFENYNIQLQDNELDRLDWNSIGKLKSLNLIKFLCNRFEIASSHLYQILKSSTSELNSNMSLLFDFIFNQIESRKLNNNNNSTEIESNSKIIESIFDSAISNNNLNMLKYMIGKDFKPLLNRYLLDSALSYGFKDIIILLKDEGYSFNLGALKDLYKFGYLDLIKYFDKDQLHLNICFLITSIRHSNLDCFKYYIDKYQTQDDNDQSIQTDIMNQKVFIEIGNSGNLEILSYFIESFRSKYDDLIDYELLLSSFLYKGFIECIKYILSIKEIPLSESLISRAYFNRHAHVLLQLKDKIQPDIMTNLIPINTNQAYNQFIQKFILEISTTNQNHCISNILNYFSGLFKNN
ncbi:hypothetical protein CYY_003714 [Polysphondylium violaceum]|uniref:Ankyrin repeat-containing protein n=1 Tax=Polysphondylium violaceum TaxID=133409 RepID=A0A8J4PXA7_9MYCE|nr:hypothetical protein CYY_003714 [Polysphondylium violaceum]